MTHEGSNSYTSTPVRSPDWNTDDDAKSKRELQIWDHFLQIRFNKTSLVFGHMGQKKPHMIPIKPCLIDSTVEPDFVNVMITTLLAL